MSLLLFLRLTLTLDVFKLQRQISQTSNALGLTLTLDVFKRIYSFEHDDYYID